LYDYEREFLPPIGCTCVNKCSRQTISVPSVKKGGNKTSHVYFGCDTGSTKCFGQRKATCQPVAKTRMHFAKDPNGNVTKCHRSCKTCSPGRNINGEPSAQACRSCAASKAWMPRAGQRNWPDCSLGQQQGACSSYPSPAQKCSSSCSPDSLTTKFRPTVLLVRDTDGANTRNGQIATEADVPVMACGKACTEGFRVQLDDNFPGSPSHKVREATIFCTTYKLVSCKWVGSVPEQYRYGSGFHRFLGDDVSGPASRIAKVKAAKKESGVYSIFAKKPTQQRKPHHVYQPAAKPGWQTTWGGPKGSLDSTGRFSISPGPGADKGYYSCMQRKHASFVGYQAHGDEEQPYKQNMPLFVSNTSKVAHDIVQDWKSTTKSRGHMGLIRTTLGAFKDSASAARLHGLIMREGVSLCAKHILLA